ncbi:MAG: methyltransferase family protein [bacterium]
MFSAGAALVNHEVRKPPRLNQQISVVIGSFLFRWRGVIGGIAFLIVYLFGNPVQGSWFLGLPFIFAGLILRFWAMGYIGDSARTRTIEVREVISNGPYRIFPHPIYAGNFALVLGVIIALNPDLWLSLGVVAGFFVEYGLIARAEANFLREYRKTPKPVKFDWRRALNDWPTWVVTGFVYFLCLMRTLWI